MRWHSSHGIISQLFMLLLYADEGRSQTCMYMMLLQVALSPATGACLRRVSGTCTIMSRIASCMCA